MYDRGIEAFLAVAASHSVSGAANLLYITQSAVSHRLRELEEQIGLILIDRQKGIRRCELTLAGEKFYPLAERWNRLWHETKHIRKTISRLSVKIGCVDSVNTLVLPELYRALVTNDPPIYLRIYTMRSIELYEKIERRELDISFVLQRQRYKHMNVVPFYREPMCVVRSQGKRSLPKKTSPEVLDPRDELFINWSPSYQMWHDRTWDPLHQSEIELDSVFLIKALLEDPRHWAIVPQSVANHLNRKKKFIVQQIDPPAPDRVIYMVTHRFTRMGASEGLDIIRSVANQLGFFNVNDHNNAKGRNHQDLSSVH